MSALSMTAKILLVLGIAVMTGMTSDTASAATPVLKWSKPLPGVIVRESSPMPINFNGGSTDIIFGAQDNKLYVINGDTGDFTPNWPQSTSNGIDSTPSSADVDGDGSTDIFVGSGMANGQCSGGGLYRFRINGSVAYKFVAADNAGSSSAQCANPSIHSSPVIGDITNNNSADISFGALGLKAWSINRNGSPNTGWPIYWDDTQFSTPALADVDGNGVTDVIMGGDSSPGAPVDHRGGMVRALKGNGAQIWEYRINEMVRSSPVVGDIDGDGQDEVVFGAGNYWVDQAGGASDATRIFVLNARTGQLKWSRDLGAQTLASPALADLDGDGVRDIAIATWSGASAGQVWAIKGNNSVISGFPRSSGGGVVIGQISTADMNNDGRQDLLVPTGGGVYAYNGSNGAALWGIRQGYASYQNTPYIADVDSNGRLDIVIVGTRPDSTGVVDRFEFATSGEAVQGARGWSMFHGDARLTGNVTPPPLEQSVIVPPGAKGQGYYIASDTGQVAAHGSAVFSGSVSGSLAKPIVGLGSLPNKDGYWLVASDGGIFSFGDAAFHGSTGAIRLNQPIVGMAPTVSGNGYWLVASDGGIFSFGDAAFHGSTGAIRLNQPITGIMRAPGSGYWLVAKDGGIFTFNAGFYGAGGGGGSVIGGSVQADSF